MIRKETEYFNFAFQRRKRIKELYTELWVIDIDDLIIAKISWIQQSQSEKQMLDIENLLLNSEKNIDYIISWCNKLHLQTFKLLDNE